MEPKYQVTRTELAQAFAEWQRRWKEDPAKFLSEAEALKLADMSYGESSATYLLHLLDKK